MENKTLYVEIRKDLYEFVDREIELRKARGDRSASKVLFIEELITAYKDSSSKK